MTRGGVDGEMNGMNVVNEEKVSVAETLAGVSMTDGECVSVTTVWHATGRLSTRQSSSDGGAADGSAMRHVLAPTPGEDATPAKVEDAVAMATATVTRLAAAGTSVADGEEVYEDTEAAIEVEGENSSPMAGTKEVVEGATALVDSVDGSAGLGSSRTATRHLGEKVALLADERDDWKAQRYVSTLRPGMVTKRYRWAPPRLEVEQHATGSTNEVTQAGEGDGVIEDSLDGNAVRATPILGRTAGENAAKPEAQTASGEQDDVGLDKDAAGDMADSGDELAAEFGLELGLELGEDVLQQWGSIAKVRAVLKATRKKAKAARAQRALQRMNSRTAESEDVGTVVAELDAEVHQRRLQQADAAFIDLHARQERRRTASPMRGKQEVQKAPVSLIQRALEANVEVEATDGLPTAAMQVNGGRHAVKLDSGARYTVAGTDWMARGERIRREAPVDFVEGIGGFLLDVIGVWAFKMLNAYGQVVLMEACIVDGCTNEFLVGVDFMQQHRALLDFSRNEVRYDDKGQHVVIPFRTDAADGVEAKVAAVRLAGSMQLERDVVAPMHVAVAAPNGEEGLFIPTYHTGAVMLATTVTKVREGKALVPAINMRGGRVKLPGRKELGVWVPLDADLEVLSLDGALATEKISAWLASLGDTKTPLGNEDDIHIGVDDQSERGMVLQLLRAYRDLVNHQGDCPPATALPVQHHIDTGDTAPIMMKRRRHAQTEDTVVDHNVHKMLASGVIEEGNGAWGFPVVLVRKKDGEIRFCVDYRALNKVTKKDVYPLPRIDETLETLGGATLFTTLDLKTGYWQIEVAPCDRDKTAFTTKRGLYRFIRMPFGLTNAPSTFQRMMNGVLRGLTWLTCLVYLDDIVIFTRGGVEKHVVQVAAVLERLKAAGLTLKLKKCVFAAESMEYLGHVLSADGVRPVDRLTMAVANFPTPQDPVEVKRFVHLAGYYRKFVEAFGSIAAPLTRLLKKDVEWQWTEEQQWAFERIKAALTTRPLLAYPNFSLPFRVVTDASKVGLGACLMQDQGRGWQPVAYASKVNSDAEAKYSITELECLAVVWAVKLFRPYVYGRSFEIVTDHAALKWLMTRPNLAGRLHRWSLVLQEYDFTISYRPGTTNVVADALSRAPVAVMMVTGLMKRGRTKDKPEGKMEDESVGVGEGNDANGQATAASVPEEETATSGEMETATPGRDVQQRAVKTTGVNSTALLRSQSGPGRPWTRAERKRVEAAAATQATTAAEPSVHVPVSTLPVINATMTSDTMTDARSEESVNPVATATTGGLDVVATSRPGGGRSGTKKTNTIEATPSTRPTPRPKKLRVKRMNAGARPIRTDVARRQADAAGSGKNVDALSGRQDSAADERTSATGGRRVTWATKLRQYDDDTGTDELAQPKTTRVTQPAAKIVGPQGDAGHDTLVVDTRSEAPEEPLDGDDALPVGTLQVTDDEIVEAQRDSRLVKKLKEKGEYGGMQIRQMYGLMVIETPRGRRVVLPPSLWSVIFKEMHGSVWAGHLRGPHTYSRVSRLYWWPNLQREVNAWVRGCPECGSRKARPREVVPPLRSIRGGDVGDRWALDVAGPFPVADGGQRYVIAALEYVTRYAVARCVERHTAESVAQFLLEDVVLKFGVFRELLTDGAPELTGYAIESLVNMLQARQINPVPYRPQMIGLVERYHRSWKDTVAMFMTEETQNDWNLWVKFAVYSYNSARHSTVSLTPNELMMGRRLRSPNELLRRTEVMEAGELADYHDRLIRMMQLSHRSAERARLKEQRRQAKYYDRRAKTTKQWRAGDRVWMYNPPRGLRATKFVHRWMGPLRVVEPAGYDNFLLQREDQMGKPETIIAHASFLVSYHYPRSLLQRTAEDIDERLRDEDEVPAAHDEATNRAIVRTATATADRATTRRPQKRNSSTMASTDARRETRNRVVELRRRRRRNRAGQYVLEYQLRPVDVRNWPTDDGRWRKRDGQWQDRWVSVREYDDLYDAGRLVEEPGEGEVV